MTVHEATEESVCPRCTGTISVGDIVQDDGTHALCPTSAAAGESVCPDCFTIRALNGACACLDR